MSRVLRFSILAVFVLTVFSNAQVKPPVKKFELNKPIKGTSTSTSTATSTLITKSIVTSNTTKSTPAAKTTSTAPVPPVDPKLPPLPPGKKRVDVDVIQEEYFVCPKDNKEFIKAGKCPVHSVVLEKRVRSFTYKCKICGYTSEKAGKCPSCKSNPPLRKFEVTYQDVTCKFVGLEPGKCPTCQQELKKVVLVEIKK